jgi:hypothetical protein
MRLAKPLSVIKLQSYGHVFVSASEACRVSTRAQSQLMYQLLLQLQLLFVSCFMQ